MHKTKIISLLLLSAVMVTPLVIWAWTSKDAPSGSLEASPVQVSAEAAANSQKSAMQQEAKPKSVLQAIVPTIDESANSDIKQRFARINNQLMNDESAQAVKDLEGLIKDYPNVVEPYINLASVYADSGQLSEARDVLMRGMQANPSTDRLFDSLNKVHGALAAQSYQKALDTSSNKTASVSLLRVDEVNTDFDLMRQLDTLKAELANSSKNSETSGAALKVQLERVAELESQLASQAALQSDMADSHDAELKKLNKELVTLKQSLVESEAKEREAVARVVRAEKEGQQSLVELKAQLEQLTAAQSETETKTATDAEEIQTLREQLAQSQQQRADMQAQLQVARADIERISQELESAKSTVSVAVNTNNGEAKQTAVSREPTEAKAVKSEPTVSAKANVASGGVSNEVAVQLVKNWAQAWSKQDVDQYVANYESDYRSSSTRSRAEWLEQRRVRLTNKAFIEVNVSDFEVQDAGDTFSVSFKQRYRSNTMDDTIRKRLVFKKSDQVEQSKIVSEAVISG